MIVPCFRCGKRIEGADSSNADYIVASDTVVNEEADIFVATVVTDKGKELLKQRSIDSLAVEDIAEEVETYSIEEARNISPNVGHITVKKKVMPVQKTGIICPECYRETDFVIWGVHKKTGVIG